MSSVSLTVLAFLCPLAGAAVGMALRARACPSIISPAKAPT